MNKPNRNDFLLLISAYVRVKRRDINISKYLKNYGTELENKEEPLQVAVENWLLQFDIGDSVLGSVEEFINKGYSELRINNREAIVDSLENLYDIYYT